MSLPTVLRVAVAPVRLASRLAPLRFVARNGTPAQTTASLPDFKCPVCGYALHGAVPSSARYLCPYCWTALGPHRLPVEQRSIGSRP